MFLAFNNLIFIKLRFYKLTIQVTGKTDIRLNKNYLQEL